MTKRVINSLEELDNKSKGMGQDMMNIIHSKASAKDIEALALSKANKVDTEQLLDSISIVHRQLKQALVLFIDSIKTELENPAESAAAKDNKQRYILTQLHFLARWAIGFDPMGLNHTNVGQCSDFLSHPEGKQLVEYTEKLMSDTVGISHVIQGSLPLSLKVMQRAASQRNRNNNSTSTVVKAIHDIPKVIATTQAS